MLIGNHKNCLDTPALWLDLDTCEENIENLKGVFNEAKVKWRPHIKGIKIPAIAHKAIRAGAIGITCSKLSEAEIMIEAGVEDVLIANQIVGIKKIARLVCLQKHANAMVIVDDKKKNIVEIRREARNLGVTVRVLVDVNIGLNRSGAKPGIDVLNLAQLDFDTSGLKFEGLMGWEGHTTSIEDPIAKRKAIAESISILKDMGEQCRRKGISVNVVSCGGSGTYMISAFQGGVTEIQVGGAIFCDRTYKSWDVGTRPALYVRSTVTSRPSRRKVT